MIETLFANPLASAFGVFGMVCLATWPLFRSRVGMLSAQMGIQIGLGLHYHLLGVHTAAAMQALSLLQIAVAIPLGRRPGLHLLYLALMPVTAAAAVLTWQGTVSLFSAAGLAAITLARMQTDTLALRTLMLVAGPFWTVHDAMVGSLPALTADLLAFTIGLWQVLSLRSARVRALAAGS